MEHAKSENMLAGRSVAAVATAEEISRDRQAYEILHWGFVALPIIAGLDKFFMVLAEWHKYLAAPFANLGGEHTFMYGVGVIEILCGLGVAFKPRLFAPVIAVWMWAIILNLLMLGNYYDIALRDFGLSLGALALWRLGQHFDSPKPLRTPPTAS